MSIQSTGLGDNEVLVVRPKRACQMLAVGQTRLYELIDRREVESFRDGGGRWITVQSMRDYVERQLERSRAA